MRGQLVGDHVPPNPSLPGRAGLRLAFGYETTRGVSIPASIDPTGLDCNALRPERPADCVQARHGPGSVELRSAVATYDPLPSLVPGLATLVVDSNATAGLRAARLAGALVALLLIGLGLSCARGAWTRIAVCLALTPGTVFVIASVNPNSLEIAGAVALAVPLFRLATTGETDRRGLVAMGAGGFSMVASRPTSIGWLGVALVAAAVCVPDLRRRVREQPGLRLAAAAWAVAIAGSVAWERLVEPSPPRGLSRASLHAAVSFVPELFREYAGVFGALDTRPPSWLSLPLALSFAVLGLCALRVADRRGRIALLLVALAMLALPIALNATVLYFTGFALQGRHVTALLVLGPILAGSLLDARRAPLTRRAGIALALAWGATQVAFWLYDAHRHAVGVSGSWRFLGRDPAWLPGPFWLWSAVTVAGAACAGAALVPRSASAGAA